MNQDTPMTHPEEQLAAYVDGSASPPEREAVEAHLASCALCREELELARSALSALSALPELEGPGLAADGLAALRRLPEPIPIRESRARTWQRVAWGAGLAAAAAVAAVFVIMGGFLSDGNGDFEAAGRAPTSAAEHPVVQQGGDHTSDSLAALARSLAAEARAADDSGTGTRLREDEAGAPAAAPAVAVEEIVDCVQRGAGLGPGVQPSYLEEATFQGAPAYIGAFVVPGSEGSPGHLELVAVSRGECQPLYFAREAL
ncbi:MAG: anti-sigma factor family protein [Actinomycetota bacterium]